VSQVTPPPGGGTTGPMETTTTSGSTSSTTTTTTGSATGTSTPSGGGPATAPTGGGEYFNQSRMKVIGLITAGVVLVGALGGIAGVAFDTERSKDTDLVQPGEDTGSSGSLGQSVSHRALRTAPRLPVADETSSPTPVGSATPDTSESPAVSESPSAGDTTPASPSASPSQGGDGGGSGVTMEGTGVQVYVPPGWNVDLQDDQNVLMSDGQGSFATAYSDTGFDPSSDAGQLIAQNLELLFPPENYTQFATGDIQALQPFGSVVSIAGMHYESLWVDNQGSFTLHGVIYVGIRQDGTLFILSVEHAPVEDWDNAPAALDDIVNASLNAFGGVG
jgi:hypothetical protein